MNGRTVAQYQIEAQLGEGGMGVVYRAWDTRLHRKVALKFLPERVAADTDSLERLRREARAASGLNHPNICTVYDLAEDGNSWFIAMELLEGQTLQQRLATRRPNIEEVVDWGLQLSDALEVAHSRGIVHRDLKPSNIFVTDRGLIKILDFGLAKKSLRSQKVALSATMSVEEVLTSPGSAVGTVAYMSPEQALGGDVDGRTDLFSLGAVLYEMICGRRAFLGETSAAIFDAILHKIPTAPTSLNPNCPPGLEHIVMKALEKDTEIRYQSATEMRVDLKRLKRASESSAHLTPEPTKKRRRSPWLLVGAGVLIVAAVVGAALWMRPEKFEPVSPGEWVALTRLSDSAVQPTISRDGRLLAFIRGGDVFMGRGQIYLKALPDGEAVALTHDDSIKLGPAFSADGSMVAYGTCCGSFDTWVVPVFGGNSRRLFANATGLNWIDPDHLLFSELKQGVHMGLVTTTKERGEARDVYLPAHERAMVHFSALSPDRKWVLVVEMGGDGNFLPCRLVPFDGSSGPRPVGPNASCLSVAWSPDGRWMYFTAYTGEHSHIWRQKFPNGTPEQVTAGPTEEAGVAFAPDGKYFVTSVGSDETTIWVHDGSGDRQITSEAQAESPQFAPDGSKVYYVVHRTDEKGAALNELWASDLSGQAQPVLPGISIDTGGFAEAYAISPDGKRVVYTQSSLENGTRRTRLWVARTDYGSSPREMKSDVDESQPFFTEDGTIYFRATEGGKNYLYRMRLDGSGRERVLPVSVIDLVDISRNGEWAVMGVQQMGEDETPFTMMYSLKEKRAPIAFCSYCQPTWSWDGKSVYSREGGQEQSKSIYAMSMAAVIAEAAKSPKGIDMPRLPGSKILPITDGQLAPGPKPGTFAYTHVTARRNLYRIPVR